MKSMLFEDSRYVVSRLKHMDVQADKERVIVLSEMLCRCYREDGKVLFSNGSALLENVLATLDDEVVVYVDVVPDNVKTISTYLRLMQYVIHKGSKNVYIIPIPCIEYFAIKGFGSDCIEKSIVVNRDEYLQTKIAKNNLSEKCKTFEKFCKAVMGIIVPEKFQGFVMLKDFHITQTEMFELLVQLPVFYDSDMRNFGAAEVSIKGTICKQYKEFIEQYQRYLKNLIFKFDMLYLEEVFKSYTSLIDDTRLLAVEEQSFVSQSSARPDESGEVDSDYKGTIADTIKNLTIQ